MERDLKPPTSFWLVAIFAIVWNIIEIYFSYFELDFLEKKLTTEEFENIQSIPLWYIIVFMVALFSEMLGSFMLFIRRKIASKFFAMSLIALLFIELYWLVVLDIEKTSMVFSIIIPVVVIAIAIFLYFYSKRAAKNGWLR